MNVCFPVERVEGLDSRISGHFGSAAAFVVVNTETNVVSELASPKAEHVHGACNPLGGLSGQHIDAAVVTSIGGPASARLAAAGIRVLQGSGGTVREALALLAAGRLRDVEANGTCSGHEHGHSCGG